MNTAPKLQPDQIEKGWRDTFSVDNPFCPCDLKSFTKAVNWTLRALAPPSGEGVDELQFYRDECALYRGKVDLIMAEVDECDEEGRAWIHKDIITEIITHEPGREHDE